MGKAHEENNMNLEQLKKMGEGQGFIAALDQSGGSTPKALELYGVQPEAYGTDENKMYDLVHQMRTRIVTSPAFTGEKIVGAILFEMTMERQVEGKDTADYLWDVKQVVPFLKIDKGLADELDGVRLMKTIPGLWKTLRAANAHHIFGTKMRSVINKADPKGIKDIVDQQFKLARIIISEGLVPIIEPEVTISISDKKEAEAILKTELIAQAKTLKPEERIIFKLSLPTVPDFYKELETLPSVVRVVALSGGYPQEEANKILKLNHGIIASFSRALSEGLTAQQTDAQFNAVLEKSIDAIYDASVNKVA